jgi:hypothetical protein
MKRRAEDQRDTLPTTASMTASTHEEGRGAAGAAAVRRCCAPLLCPAGGQSVTLGHPYPPAWLDTRREQPVPSTRNKERSGEARNAATLQRRGWAGRLRASHEWRLGTRHARGNQRHSLPSDPPPVQFSIPLPTAISSTPPLPGERPRHGCRRARAVPPPWPSDDQRAHTH